MSRMEEKFNRRNEIILTTAEQLIKQYGYHGVKMTDIATEMDIAKGTLYLHYKSKESLVYAIVEPKMNHFLEIVQTIVQSEMSSQERVKTLLSEGFRSDFFSFVIAGFPDMGAVFTEDRNEKLKDIQQRITNHFVQLIEDGKTDKTFNTQIPATFAALQLFQLFDPLLYNTLVNDGDMNHEEFVAYTTSHFLNGVEYKGECL